MSLLNPELYAALKRVFGHVKISNAGQAMMAVYTPGLDGRLRLQVVQAGEYYVIECPYCHDTSGHLYVNHRWGVRDQHNGTRNLWLANCFLCRCMRDWENRRDLAERLEGYDLEARAGVVKVGQGREAPPLGPVDLPDDFKLLRDLPKGHAARRYVRRRGFSPRELSDIWGVGFSSDCYRYDIPGRLVIPLRACLRDVTDPSELADDADAWEVVGYQGRSLGDDAPRRPKYLTSQGTARSELLYGLDRVPLDSDGPVIVCEGPTDVWRAGPGAVALLGKAISAAQCKLLRTVLPGRDVVVMLDPEAATEARKVAKQIREVLARDLISDRRPGRVVVARLPDERDPGDCTRQEIMDAARTALQRRKPRRQT